MSHFKSALRAAAIFAAIGIVSATVSCDHPPLSPESKAGSFTVENVCGAIAQSPDGSIFTWRQLSSSKREVDKRSASGDLIWLATMPSSGELCTGMSDQSGNLIASSADSLYLMEAGSGAIRWRAPIAHVISLALGSNQIFAGTRASTAGPTAVYALNPANGSVQWSRPIQNQAVGVAFDATRSVVYGIRRAGAIAMRPADGSVMWDAPFIGSRDGYEVAIAADGSLAVVSGADFFGEIDFYGTDGNRKWFNSRATHLTGSPVIDHTGVIYVPYDTEAGAPATIRALAPVTGAVQWNHDFDRIASDIVVDAERTVYVIARAAPDSAFQLYGLRDGAVVSAVSAAGASSGSVKLTLHTNKLIYYLAGERVFYTPTAGISPSAPWPMANRDALRTNRFTTFFPPD